MVSGLFQNRMKLALLIFFTALLVRVVYVVFVLNTRGLERGYDAGDYIQFAEQMHEQGWMVEDISTIQLHAGPGYPLILYIDMAITGSDSFYFSIALNIFLSALLCLVIFNLLIELGLSTFLSALAAFWAAFYVHFLRYVSELNKETIVLFCLILVVKLLYQSAYSIKLDRAVLAGLVYTYLIHVDERYFFFSPFIVLFLSIPYSKKALVNASSFTLTIALLMLPWLYRNYVVFERPVILTERTAPFTDKLLGYNTPANPYRQDPISPYKRSNLAIYESFRDSMLNGEKVQSKGYRYIDLMEEAISEGDIPRTQSPIQAKLMEFLELYKPFHFSGSFTANGYRYHREWKLVSNIVYGLQYGLLLLLFPFGLVQLYRSNKRFLSIALIFIGIHGLIHVFIAYGLQRYRVPMDFLLIVVAAFGVEFILKRFRKKNEVV